MRRATALLVACLIWSPASASDTAPVAIGLRQLHATSGAPIPIAVWYPAATPADTMQADAIPAPGRHPLILLSHGSGGTEFGHHDWAEYLAGHGYVVVAPRHWGDSDDQPDGRGSDVQLVGRVWQARAALDSVLADSVLGPAIDGARIGMIGFSAGGYTTLVMAGARPDFGRWQQHCAAHADQDGEFCPPGIWQRLPIITRPGWTLPPPDRRVGAAVVIAPAAILFDAAGLRDVTIPLRLYGASDDHSVINRWNVAAVAAALPAPQEVHYVPGDHLVFLAPCSTQQRQRLPVLCNDGPGVDRPAIHRQMVQEMVVFFDAQLPPRPQ